MICSGPIWTPGPGRDRKESHLSRRPNGFRFSLSHLCLKTLRSRERK